MLPILMLLAHWLHLHWDLSSNPSTQSNCTKSAPVPKLSCKVAPYEVALDSRASINQQASVSEASKALVSHASSSSEGMTSASQQDDFVDAPTQTLAPGHAPAPRASTGSMTGGYSSQTLSNADSPHDAQQGHLRRQSFQVVRRKMQRQVIPMSARLPASSQHAQLSQLPKLMLTGSPTACLSPDVVVQRPTSKRAFVSLVVFPCTGMRSLRSPTGLCARVTHSHLNQLPCTGVVCFEST